MSRTNNGWTRGRTYLAIVYFIVAGGVLGGGIALAASSGQVVGYDSRQDTMTLGEKSYTYHEAVGIALCMISLFAVALGLACVPLTWYWRSKVSLRVRDPLTANLLTGIFIIFMLSVQLAIAFQFNVVGVIALSGVFYLIVIVTLVCVFALTEDLRASEIDSFLADHARQIPGQRIVSNEVGKRSGKRSRRYTRVEDSSNSNSSDSSEYSGREKKVQC